MSHFLTISRAPASSLRSEQLSCSPPARGPAPSAETDRRDHRRHRRRRAAPRISWSMSATVSSSRPTRPISPPCGCHPHQAGAVAAALFAGDVHRRRPCRRARHARIQHRPRRPARRRRPRVHDRARHRAEPHKDNFLRQGAASRGLRRYLLLVAEPARRDGYHQRPRRLSQGLDSEVRLNLCGLRSSGAILQQLC